MTDESGLYHDTCHHRIYYMSCAEFDELWRFAQGKCQICGKPETETGRGRLYIDHLHNYGVGNLVRGLLCHPCNMRMERVDKGKERGAEDTWRYQRRAWFARQHMFARGFVVNPTRRRWGVARQ